jgi:hypothetical protein
MTTLASAAAEAGITADQAREFLRQIEDPPQSVIMAFEEARVAKRATKQECWTAMGLWRDGINALTKIA